jgi:hypothetical protein
MSLWVEGLLHAPAEGPAFMKALIAAIALAFLAATVTPAMAQGTTGSSGASTHKASKKKVTTKKGGHKSKNKGKGDDSGKPHS